MNRWCFLSVTLFAVARVNAAHVSVQVLDRDARPVSGLVVTLHAASPIDAKASNAPAIMDQVEQRFVPFILPVHVGTAVTFPNSDSVAHQVYSFSQPKHFELGLYRGRPHAPVIFDKPGIVVLGCNIHDKMIGYIYVTDASYFGKTNERGLWRDTVPRAEYRVEIWSPLLARDEPSLRRTIVASDTQPTDVTVRLTRTVQSEPPAQTDRRLRDY
jgi:plastocyanin